MRVLKSYGTQGGVIVSAPEFGGELRENEPAFITFDGLPVPFFIEEMTPRGGAKYYLKLEDIDTLEMAEELVGKDIILEDEESEDEVDVVGYTLYDQKRKKIGRVTAFEDIPGNPCLEIEGGALVPCPDECILDIDEKGRKIYLQIADGLL